jgi:hypothetical protein
VITKWKKFILTWRSYPLVIGAPCVTRRKMSIKEIKEDNEDLRRIRSHVMNEVEEEKEEKYKQLEFEFDEDLVAPI